MRGAVDDFSGFSRPPRVHRSASSGIRNPRSDRNAVPYWYLLVSVKF